MEWNYIQNVDCLSKNDLNLWWEDNQVEIDFYYLNTKVDFSV